MVRVSLCNVLITQFKPLLLEWAPLQVVMSLITFISNIISTNMCWKQKILSMHISREGQPLWLSLQKLIARWLEHFRQSRMTLGKAFSRKVSRPVRSLDIWWLLEKLVCWKQNKQNDTTRIKHNITHTEDTRLTKVQYEQKTTAIFPTCEVALSHSSVLPLNVHVFDHREATCCSDQSVHVQAFKWCRWLQIACSIQ